MIDTDKELEWVREDREDRHIGSISKHECVVDVDWVEELLTEVKRLREESKKKGNVLSTLDEMIRNEESHVEMMKALEQGLDLPETWKEMIE
jgi:hypothetical protein